jgi:hypothetical protein
MLSLAEAKGTPLERFSRGTFKVFEAVGLGVEKLITGQTTSRRPLPVPDSVRRLQARDPAGQLARVHCERLLLEDELKESLTAHGFTITADHIRTIVGAAA